jgi:hypothetical protein
VSRPEALATSSGLLLGIGPSLLAAPSLRESGLAGTHTQVRVLAKRLNEAMHPRLQCYRREAADFVTASAGQAAIRTPGR